MKNISLEINGVLFDKLTVPEKYEEMFDGQGKKTQIDDREGMVYVFSKDCSLDFVNENRHLGFDIIMVNAQDKITAIHTMQKAVFSEGETEKEHRKNRPNYTSPTPYRYVFELKSGIARKLGAKVGDRLDVDYTRLYPFRNAENIRYAFQLKKIVPKKEWIAPLLQRMEKIASSHDAVRELNLEFVGGQQDQKMLLSAGWISLPGIDTEQSENWWLQKNVHSGGQHVAARVCVSKKGHFRHLYFLHIGNDGSYIPTEKIDFDAVVDEIRPDFVNSQIQPPPEEIDEELEKVIWNLSNPSVKEEWSERQKKFYIWSKEFIRLNDKSKYYRYRLLDGMLRFDDFCDYDFAMSGPLCAAADLNYRWAMAKLIIISLTHMSGSNNSSFWNDLGYTLDRMHEQEAAFYCFANAWNQDFDAFYANNLWLVGNAIIPELLKNRIWDSLFPVASMMLSAISDKATVKQQVEVLCIVGLIYEKRDDFKEAEQYYAAAYDVYKRKSNDKKSFWALRWDFPVLYQALMRGRMTDKRSCRAYVDAQLKTFPQTPLESGFGGRLPVEYVEGDGHGDHWECVTESEQLKDPEKFFGAMIREGKVDSKGIELPGYERGDGLFTQGIGFRYSIKNDSASPIESYFLLGMPEKGDSHHFASAFPVFKKGHGSSIIRPLRSMNVWGNAIEATVEFDLRKNGNTTLAFFLPDYCGEFLRLKPDTAYRIELGAFAYSVSRFKEREFKIDKGLMLEEEKLRLRKEGKDDNIDSVSVHMTSDFCNISRSFSGWADDVSIVAPINRIEKFVFLGNKCLALWLKFDERGADITLPVFLKEGNLDEGYCPQVGDVIECGCWLQGWVHESHELNFSQEIPEMEEDSDDDVFDFDHALLGGVRGTDYDLESLAVRALEQKGKVEDLCRCPEALPGDADFSCYANGETRLVKIMTGYFENEDDCRSAWQKFRVQTPDRPDGRPICLLSVVGIKLSDDQYKIYYNGFSKLNPALKNQDDELDLEQPREDFLRTPQEMGEIIADAWRNLDVCGVREILADGYEYNSMWVLETMHGADKYLAYLSGKFESIRDRGNKPLVSAVRSDENYVEIELQQTVNGKSNDLMLQFKIQDGKIISGWMGEPTFRRVK